MKTKNNKKIFKYNILKQKDNHDRDIQWWEKMEDGTQLLLPYNENKDSELSIFFSSVGDVSDSHVLDAEFICFAIDLVNAKMPNVYLDMEEYVKGKFLVLVNENTRKNLFCFSSETVDNKIAIAWNICDICGVIARFFKSRKNTDRRIMLSKKTHITDIRIERDEDGDIIITPTIENL